ncbi:MHC class I-2 antigen [Ornithorhynchus anatinus]|uniref:MHC class I-2 antigen n=1 Tax=Ornithorhynchus anatinus TaxID=9258 RepID=A7X5N3_ORNAN|nr:MHC class I-2 antigen [Ornithorhynchus anatinus]ABU86901.1 MHC class I-2 antigen [Ornithorhynchus anatinus]
MPLQKDLVLIPTLPLVCSVSLGSHFLRYFYTAVSRPGPGVPAFTAVGYLDDQQFVRFDSIRQKAEGLTTWIQGGQGPDYWEQQNQDLRGTQQIFLQNLQVALSYYNQSEGGYHSYQEMYGCELRTDGSTGKAYDRYGYDGQDYITLDLDTLTWTAANPEAQYTKRKWEANKKKLELEKAYLQGQCVYWISEYLKLGGDSLNRTEPPSVRVTRHPSQDEDNVTLRCQALGFYPADIRMRWQRDGEDLTRDTEHVETRPGGDGTFQKWTAVVGVSHGQEQRYVCVVDHDGLANPLAVGWVSDLSPRKAVIMGALATVLIVTAVLAGVVILRKRRPGEQQSYYIPAASE